MSASTSRFVIVVSLGHHAATISGAAGAAPARMLRRRVIKRQFFTRCNVAAGEEEHVPVHDAAEAIRIARVIDVGGRVAAAARIDAPLIVQLADANLPAFRDTARSFPIADPFTEKFADLSTRRQWCEREAATSIDPRFPGDERRRASAFHFAAG